MKTPMMTSKDFSNMFYKLNKYHYTVIQLGLPSEILDLNPKGQPKYNKNDYEADLTLFLDFYNNGDLKNLIWNNRWMGLKPHESICACAVPLQGRINNLISEINLRK